MSIVLYRIVKFIVGRRPQAAVILLGSLFFGAFPYCAQAQDTVQVLDEVEVTTVRAPSKMQTATPTQVVDAQQIEQQGLMQLSDAVRQMAGVTLKDYGGVGGMKTVSARGLGSQFSTVTIDGIAVGDAQNGQVDLSRYLLGNAAYVSFSQGQQQEQLLSARAYAAGNVLNLESAEPRFFHLERTNLKVGMEAGSFAMLSPSALWEQRWNRRLKTSLWVNWLKSDGNYPFTLYYTPDHQGQTSEELRRHSAMQMTTVDGNLFYNMGPSNTLSAKIHYMNGRHELPGPVQLYNQSMSAQNTHEKVAFVQGKWRVERQQWQWQLLGKVQQTYDMFEDSAANTMTGYQMNDYKQREGYLSASGVWHATGWLDIKGAADGSIADLHSNLAQRSDVVRDHLTAVAALRVHTRDSAYNRLEINLNALGTMVRDQVADLDTMPLYRRLSPFIGINYTIHGHTTLRGFYKETYRVPNFSELYFFAMPRDLRPERARQLDLGITHSGTHTGITVDAYYNRVTDKIMAIPTQNMFLWSMQNLGYVEILGLDATASTTFDFQRTTLNIELNYSYQRALDRTDSTSVEGRKTYGHQIAYTPRHSGGGNIRWETPWGNIGASAMVVGDRYYRMENNDETRMPAYCDIGMTADRDIDLRWGTMRVQVQVLNLWDVQYEVVRSYPMMGRNYRLKITYIF